MVTRRSSAGGAKRLDWRIVPGPSMNYCNSETWDVFVLNESSV
jgi:hypothetical protein